MVLINSFYSPSTKQTDSALQAFFPTWSLITFPGSLLRPLAQLQPKLEKKQAQKMQFFPRIMIDQTEPQWFEICKLAGFLVVVITKYIMYKFNCQPSCIFFFKETKSGHLSKLRPQNTQTLTLQLGLYDIYLPQYLVWEAKYIKTPSQRLEIHS